SAVVGARVCNKAAIDWNSTFRAMRISLGDTAWQESSETSFERCFDTSGWSAGTYRIRVEAAAQGDNNWSSPRVAQAAYQLLSTSVPVTPVPPAQNSSCLELGLTNGDLVRGAGDEIDIISPGCLRRWVP